MKEKMNKLNEELLSRFLIGQCSEDELLEVNVWINESEENARLFFKFEELYCLGKEGALAEMEINKAEKRLHDRLEQEKPKQQQHKVRYFYGWLKYAMLLVGAVAACGIGYFAFGKGDKSEVLLVVTTTDTVKELTLPDGSKVWLNKNTTLRYPQEFASGGREIYLEGEGYFEIKRDLGKPFVVQSEAMQVRVLGTVFNLKTDKAKMSAVASLLRGEIEVKGNHEEGMVVLAPGQKAELDGVTRRLVVKQVDTGFENWHARQFIFNKADIYTIARTLEISYGVRIILAPDIDLKKTYSGTLNKKDDVESVMNQITNAIPVEYKIIRGSSASTKK